ncbi:tetratricopeptide repeat protein [Capilliphycus salinus ALCB114379]|uniref:tetratricopeptide repeat protein n=1 Tax=Capilliphycus salinus TaxID=2768948 RepID=UPI0039A64EF3
MDDSKQSITTAMNLYQQAIVYLRQQEFQQAILSCQQALKHEPKLAVAYQTLGMAFQLQGEEEEAEQYYVKAVEIQPDLAEVYANLGSIYTKQKQWEKGIEAYKNLIKFEPKSAVAYRNIAQILTHLNRQKEAAQYWYEALQLDPDWATAEEHLTLGNMLLKDEKPLQAISCYQRTIQLKPDSFEAAHNLGEAFSQLERWPEAIQSYEKALELNPNSAITYQRLADAFVRIQSWDAAISNYQKSIEIDPNSFQGHQKLAQLLYQQQQYEPAIQAYLKAIEIQPYYQWSYLKLWNILAEHKKLNDALTLYQNIIKHYPHAPLVELNLAEILTRLGKIKPAIAAYQRAIYKKIKVSHPEIVETYWDSEKPLNPSFIIIGTQKGGTTSLYRYLEKHPQILPAIKKEIYFWNHHYKRGLDWYVSHFPSLKDSTQFLTGEATPSYLEDEEVAGRIAEAFPKMKLILVLRNPVERTVSQYYHWVRLGLENRSLSDAISAELELLGNYPNIDPNYWEQTHKYIWRGIYIEFIQKWMMYFPPENFLILKSEELYEQPQIILQEVFKFLNLPDFSLTEFTAYNKGYYQQMPPEIHRQLKNFFHSQNQKLEEFLGRKFNWN